MTNATDWCGPLSPEPDRKRFLSILKRLMRLQRSLLRMFVGCGRPETSQTSSTHGIFGGTQTEGGDRSECTLQLIDVECPTAGGPSRLGWNAHLDPRALVRDSFRYPACHDKSC
ncbi:hypothetical protein PAXRUDRAFT_324806 [Paxillus rubicundulus Ve08.2h10]|uniref:Uncharacterized protein n=1 Tax=Paxillus rubicundulus Ve08.2h10 TaxID=930991 RepID=A0A0D0DF17_9AGAM|nr:hypothetical protein PAXRUDRAFT_324806 [Paxillus rubicundulus Ve08.2h10]